MTDWMIYGANGYTGELIAREAAARGHDPILGGRNAGKVRSLAQELKLRWRAFDLEKPDSIAHELKGVSLVLHCAGPFGETSPAMVNGCLASGAHYLDITGEIAVFESIMARSGEATARGVTLMPGVGFDVVPTDCLAAMLAEQLPSADELTLAFYSRGGEISRGTMKTMIEGIGEGGAIRRDGKIIRVPMVYDVREIPFSCGRKLAMTIPWGDVSTAFHTTGIPNIRVYSASSPRAVRRARLVSSLSPLLKTRPLRRLLKRVADRRTGPDQTTRTAGRVYLWGRVADKDGAEKTMTMTTPEGYAFTILSSLAAVEQVLARPVRPGSFTPARYLGARFVTTIPGVVIP